MVAGTEYRLGPFLTPGSIGAVDHVEKRPVVLAREVMPFRQQRSARVAAMLAVAGDPPLGGGQDRDGSGGTVPGIEFVDAGSGHPAEVVVVLDVFAPAVEKTVE